MSKNDKPSTENMNINKDSSNADNSATIEDIESITREIGLDLYKKEDGKRIYRRKSDYEDPNQPRYSEVNRLKKQFSLRMYPEMQEKVDEAAKQEGMTRQEWVERAILESLEKRR